MLILDPHYVGTAVLRSDVSALRAGGFAGWKPVRKALSSRSAYNLALPRTINDAAKRPVNYELPIKSLTTDTDWAIEVVDEGSEA